MGAVTHNVPDESRIRHSLSDVSLWRSISVVETTGSTNADLSAMARDGEPEGLALVAMEQTAGRGRLDRTWVSPPRSSVALSVLLQPVQEFHQWGWLSLLAGMAVSSALEELAPDGVDVTLKWPNDVLISGKKVCGILSERIEHPSGAKAIIGIGINIDLAEEQLPVPAATSLALEGMPTDQSAVVAGVLRHLARYYDRWQTTGDLRTDYAERCASIGADLTIHLDPERRVAGVGRGVDEYGRLQVATARGVQTFAVGDVVHARLG